ncbi:MAG TPA: mechanosensitive ion channel domain-containing protein [Candidatus Limnocylindrales bacterium]|nr:mechanosensitive ion channel domain-containing protein [Candidatus Limnocylindrales bacterium]
MPITLDSIVDWIIAYVVPFVIGAVVLLGLYRILQPLIHRLVSGLVHVQQAALSEASPAEETEKRAATLELVLEKVLRAALLIAFVFLVLGVFDLWPLLASLGLIAAAITLAGQQIVLDYLMGILILIEGPYFKGDWILINGPGVNVEGEVEEIGLRRTTLRDPVGSVHSVSNGLIRVSSNTTRVYSLVSVDVQVLRPTDLDRALAIAATVGRELASAPEWDGRLFEAPVETSVVALTLDGATIRVQRRVPPTLRGPVTSELRRRLSAALAAEGIGMGRWDTPPLPAGDPAMHSG